MSCRLRAGVALVFGGAVAILALSAFGQAFDSPEGDWHYASSDPLLEQPYGGYERPPDQGPASSDFELVRAFLQESMPHQTRPSFDPALITQGREAFEDSCQDCHEAERALEKRKTYAQWLGTVREMAAKPDAEIPQSAFVPIATYLAAVAGVPAEPELAPEVTPMAPRGDEALVARGEAAFQARCLDCHDAARSLEKRKTYTDWMATVRRMAGKPDADIPESDWELIARYLASVAGVEAGGGVGVAVEQAAAAGGWSFSATVSTMYRTTHIEDLESPGFFADVWLAANWQSSGPISANVMVCTSCHSDFSLSRGFTFELVEGSATLDINRLIAERRGGSANSSRCCEPAIAAKIKGGRFLVPFGAFSGMSHPGVYRTVTNPLIFDMDRRKDGFRYVPVIAMPYSDEGIDLNLKASLFGDIRISADLYMVNGFQGDLAISMADTRGYEDNNRNPGLGARVTLAQGGVRVGGSFTGGQMRDDGVEKDVRAACQDPMQMGHICWVVSLAGRELGRRSAVPDDWQVLQKLSPTHAVHFPQHKLEPLLWRRVEQHELIDFRPGCRCAEITQDAEGVSATITEESTDQSLEARAAYLVGCDGASSHVRRFVDIRMDGPVIQHMLGLHFTADLSRYVGHRPSALYWVLNRDMVGALIAHWLPTEWVLNVPYFPPQQQPQAFSEQACLELIYKAIGTRDVADLVLKNVGSWMMAARLAETYRKGRIFLAGDAAHILPPTGGLGLNTGVGDAHNLAWKLGAVLRGTATSSLLDSYESERRPIAQGNIDQSVRNLEVVGRLGRLVGLRPENRKRREALQNSALLRRLPARWQLRIVDRAVKLGLRKLARLDAPGRRADRLRAEFAARLPSKSEIYRLGMDLGYWYRQGAVIAESSPKPQPANPVTQYLPIPWPGARLPNLWVERDQQRVALFDALRPDGYLLVHPEGKQAWQAAVQAAGDQFAMPVECLAIGPPGEADLTDSDGRWAERSEVGPTGAVLVRPDGHVAWRCADLPSDSTNALPSVMECLMAAKRPE